MREVLAFYKYPEPSGREYYRNDFVDSNTVIEIFDYCQILLAHITKSGWKFLVEHYGYEKLYALNNKSGWINCDSLNEYKLTIDYEMSIVE